MKRPFTKRAAAALLSGFLALTMTACNQGATQNKDAVPVQSVAALMGYDLSGSNRYNGVAEARSSQKIQKDADKQVAECLVQVGDEVKAGDVLFRYDLDALNLQLESAKLEIEQQENLISSYDTQISELEKEKNQAPSGDKLSYTLQIQEAKINKSEAEYNLKQKKNDLKQLESTTVHAEVKSEVDGVVQSINENPVDGQNNDAYITIMETGTYRIKGTVSESNSYSIYEGMTMLAVARADQTKMWNGVVTQIDTGNDGQTDEQTNYEYDYGDMGGEKASRYSFYVDLEDAEGLMMGQHVYLIPEMFKPAEGTIVLPSGFIDQSGGEAKVWVAGRKDTLEPRAVVLGEYLAESDSYVIESGLSLDDYLAEVTDDCVEGAAAIKQLSVSEQNAADQANGMPSGDSFPEEDFPSEDLGEEPMDDSANEILPQMEPMG